MALAPGDYVDRYEIVELLGEGGMGEVYRARDPRLDRHVALKVVRVDRGLGTDGGARLLREARSAAALLHPNVLAIYDVGEVATPERLHGMPYVAMELVVGKTLRAFVGDPSVPVDRRIGWIADVARALGAAHAAGIIHRDVKPENVMIRFDGVVKVLDFGIARRVARAEPLLGSADTLLAASTSNERGDSVQTAAGTIVGTPYYMAPEQLRAEALDGRSDQFAWGVVAYELLCGVAPWDRSTSPLVTVSDILSRDPPRLAERGVKVSRDVSDSVARAMAKNPADRFASMDALVASLGGAVSGPAMVSVESTKNAAAPAIDGAAATTSAKWSARGRAATAVAVVAAGAWIWNGEVAAHRAPRGDAAAAVPAAHPDASPVAVARVSTALPTTAPSALTLATPQPDAGSATTAPKSRAAHERAASPAATTRPAPSSSAARVDPFADQK